MRHKPKHVTNIAGPSADGGLPLFHPAGERSQHSGRMGRVDGGQGKQYGLARGRKRTLEPSFSEPDPPVTAL